VHASSSLDINSACGRLLPPFDYTRKMLGFEILYGVDQIGDV
jgi:hypothetical protein